MNKEKKWLQWAVELQSLAQAGLTYGKDAFDRERYERIREISAEIMAHMTEIPVEKVRDLFCNETGYQTPKLDTRAAIFEDGKILFNFDGLQELTEADGWFAEDFYPWCESVLALLFDFKLSGENSEYAFSISYSNS